MVLPHHSSIFMLCLKNECDELLSCFLAHFITDFYIVWYVAYLSMKLQNAQRLDFFPLFVNRVGFSAVNYGIGFADVESLLGLQSYESLTNT